MLHDGNDTDDENKLTNNNDNNNVYQYSNNNEHNQNSDGSNNKNRCFNIFPSIFRKYSKYKTHLRKKHHSFSEFSDDHQNSSTLSSSPPSTVPFPITDKCLIPGSPISPRVKNFNLDMKILVLSRQDNPYLSKFSKDDNDDDNEEYFITEPSTPIFSRRNRSRSTRSYSGSSRNLFNIGMGSGFLFHTNSTNNQQKYEDEKNLHEQLVRSPPPHFPEKLSHFLFNENLLNGNMDDDHIRVDLNQQI